MKSVFYLYHNILYHKKFYFTVNYKGNHSCRVTIEETFNH